MRRPALLLLLLATLGSPMLPIAERTARADDSAVAEAQKRFREGLELADESNHEAARLKFQQAWAVYKAPAVLYNLARSEQLGGRDVEAFEHFRLFLGLGAADPKITDTMRERAKQNMADLSAKVGFIVIEARAAARVTIDGKVVEELGEPIPVTPGSHVVEATLDADRSRAVVDCAPGATVRAKLEPARTPGADATADPTADGWGTPRIVTFGVLTTTALTAAVLALVFRVGAQGDVDEARDLLKGRSCRDDTGADCTRAASLKDDRDTKVTLSAVSLAAAGVIGAGAVAVALLWPTNAASRAFVPVLGPGYGGASFSKHF